MRTEETPRQAALLGAAVALGGVLLATVVSPSVRWTENALSNLLWTDGTVALSKGRRQRGVVSAGLGTATVAAWVTWELTGPMFRPGLALPEVVGAVAFAAWVVDVSHTA